MSLLFGLMRTVINHRPTADVALHLNRRLARRELESPYETEEIIR